MEDEKKSQENTEKQIISEAAVKINNTAPVQAAVGARTNQRGGDKRRNFRGRKGGGRGRGEAGLGEEFEQKIIDIARVTRVMAGGKRMRFRACVAVGNKKGRVAIGLAKGSDVTGAVTKAVNKAKKNFLDVPLVNETIPHEILEKFGAAKILFKPAKKGRGIIAGGAVRIVLELAGVKNVTSKILGSGNKVNNVKCAMAALGNLKKAGIKKVKAEENVKVNEN